MIRLLVLFLSILGGCQSYIGESTPLTRIALGSCANQNSPILVFDQIVRSNPGLYLSLGDAIYADYDFTNKTKKNVTSETLKADWKTLADRQDWQLLVKEIPVLATWDNHDYGDQEAGKDFNLKQVSKQIFLEFFQLPQSHPVRNRPGIYRSEVFGPEGRQVKIVLLDTRSFKVTAPHANSNSPGSVGRYLPETSPGSLLGDSQWLWLEEQFASNEEIIFLVSSTQVIPDAKRMDEWGIYPAERSRLLDLVQSKGKGRTVILSGNVHFSEVSSLRDSNNLPVYEFTASGLTHTNRFYADQPNQYRTSGPFAGLNFGVIDINWNQGDRILLEFSAMDVDGNTAFKETISIPNT